MVEGADTSLGHSVTISSQLLVFNHRTHDLMIHSDLYMWKLDPLHLVFAMYNLIYIMTCTHIYSYRYT